MMIIDSVLNFKFKRHQRKCQHCKFFYQTYKFIRKTNCCGGYFTKGWCNYCGYIELYFGYTQETRYVDQCYRCRFLEGLLCRIE